MALFSWVKRKKRTQQSNGELLSSSHTKKLARITGYKFKDKRLFVKALTHRSYLELVPEIEKSNERIEFLGDSVLGIIVAEYIFKKFEEKDEGFLTKIRSHLVDKESLYDTAVKIGLSDLLLYDKRFLNDSHEGMKKISADAVEALIGAIYLDGGFQKAKKFVNKWIIKPNIESGRYIEDRNYKGKLLELCHELKISPPVYYTISENGEEHNKDFVIKVVVGSDKSETGMGKNKKKAEQNAAKNMLSKLNQAE